MRKLLFLAAVMSIGCRCTTAEKKSDPTEVKCEADETLRRDLNGKYVCVKLER